MNQNIEKKKRCRALKKGQDSIPAFLLKTYDILENPANSDIVSWNEEGDAFIVKKVNDFSEIILPRSFKHNNFASFVRQLNMYDFHKSRHDNNDNEFKHKLFRRGQRELLSKIKRKTNDQVPNQLSLVKNEIAVHDTNDLSTQMALLSNKQSELEKLIKIIIKQNEKFQKENKYLWNELMKNKQKGDQQQERLLMAFLQSFVAPQKQGKKMLMLKSDPEEPYIEMKKLKHIFQGEDKMGNLDQTLEGFTKQQLLQGLVHALNCQSIETKKKRKITDDDISVSEEYEYPQKKFQQEITNHEYYQPQEFPLELYSLEEQYPLNVRRDSEYDYEGQFGQMPPPFIGGDQAR
ncbi:hypothetical protein pb186bvf_017366 [Paramecium bursaria]